MSNEDIEGLSASLGAFEAALNVRKVDLPEVKLARVLLCLDASEQDATTVAMVGSLCAGRTLEVSILADGGADPEPAQAAIRATGGRPTVIPPPAGQEPFQRILAAAEGHDLVAVPCPFLRHLDAYGQQSVGGTLDVLMARCAVPLLITRGPLADPSIVRREHLLPVVFDSIRNPEAAAWALALADSGARIRLIEVADTHVLRSAAHLLGEYLDAHALDEDTLERLEAREHAGLVAALQRAAAERDLRCVVRVQTGDAAAVVAEAAAETETLVVTSCPRDPRDPELGRVQAFLKASRGPVLVV